MQILFLFDLFSCEWFNKDIQRFHFFGNYANVKSVNIWKTFYPPPQFNQIEDRERVALPNNKILLFAWKEYINVSLVVCWESNSISWFLWFMQRHLSRCLSFKKPINEMKSFNLKKFRNDVWICNKIFHLHFFWHII